MAEGREAGEVEAVAEALWRHAGFGDIPGEESFAERPESIRVRYHEQAAVAIAALEASRSTPAEPSEETREGIERMREVTAKVGRLNDRIHGSAAPERPSGERRWAA